ncbi:hypothetical protein BGZ97_003391 [Linnemannia gamsii]|uniref:Uncharacterized protein n=1 Tax=Linnemannia gamsii TaxID=64522 RepID=A0A9P6RLF8_9FUNG|nr:hypothetical protein BGZ97_003391 [Linnemannia gamsii]
MSRHLDAMPNNVTTLELHWSENTRLLQSSSSLHDYLCSSPHLLHLRAPKARYYIDYMDVFRRAHDHRTPKNNHGILPNVWHCRRLETLHLGFEISRQPLTGTPAIFLRILFGYIARVLPLLRDFKSDILVDNTHRLRQTIDLGSGFCLLAKLKYLEQLDLGGREYTAETYEVSWMSRAGSSSQEREARQKLVKTWDDIIKLELLGYGVNGDYHTFRDDIRRMSHVSAGMVEELNFNGCLLDVARMVKIIDTDGFKCWPRLQRRPILYRRS